ncbi:MAG: biotin--[acetyl-CoA-carboxylase] ligase [Erythrobacter sp.]
MIKYVAQTGSTNADLMMALHAHQKLEEGHWLIADRQTDGRGRQGRYWHDGTGNFMGSTIIALQSGEYPGATLNFPISLAVRETLSEFIPDATQLMLKWPNDVLLQGAKVSGILMELFEFQVVAGIGVNLATAPDLPDRATIALADISDDPPSRDRFASRLIHHIANEVDRWRKHGEEATRVRWLAFAHPRGSAITVHEEDGSLVEGTFEGLHAGGGLQMRLTDGSMQTVHAGDVSLS